MTETAEQVKIALLDAVVELAETRQQAQGAQVAGALLRHYFARTPLIDLAEKDPIDLYASTVRHLQLAERRDPHQTLTRIYNPNSDEDGWSSSHTVIDIVCEDMPFIVDSVLALLERLGYQVHVLVHPMFEIERGSNGEIIKVRVPTADPGYLESVLHIEIDRMTSHGEIDELDTHVQSTLTDVRAAVQDWLPMRKQVLELADELDGWATEAANGSPRFVADVGSDPAEVAELLRWMESGFFTFVGYREYTFTDDSEHPTIESRPSTGLGTLRQSEVTARDLGGLPPETAAQSRLNNVLNLTKANTFSTVHRSVPLDYVGIKELDADGKVTGERRILGLFTSSVYSGNVTDIPSVRKKVEAVTERLAFHSTSHDHNRLLNALQTYPRDELFQIDVDQLESMALAILDLRDRRQVSLLMRRDLFGRFLSCLVFVPRDRHSTVLRLKIQSTLMDVYDGTSCRFSTEISDAPLARLHIVIYTHPTPTSELPDLAAVEARLVQITRTWDDYLRASLVEAHGEDHGLDLLSRYGAGFEQSYRANVLAESAVHDIERLETVDEGGIDVALHRPLEAGPHQLRCKIYRAGAPIVLSKLIPLLHDLGALVVDEHPYEVEPDGHSTRFIYDIGLELNIELDRDDRARVREAILAVWNGQAESDSLSKLVVSAGLSWRDVSILRACTRYLVQIGARYSLTYIVDTLNNNPQIAAHLVAYFNQRFDPAIEDGDRVKTPSAELMSAIDSVASLDADRILRSFLTIMTATVRTNHWQSTAEGDHRPALALKLNPRLIPEIPKPAPAAEIFVYSPRTEGVHLRSGRVARGGLRWSERMEDYRTEILGLMKAQTVKNSVIVPVGAKGGFVARNLPVGGTRDEVMAEVVACYKTFVGALLDVTDNVVDDIVEPPESLVRLDGDDPYLVVAADKGTATFSDTANEIASERGFWLDDAFASGGSVGYDHKALAITARGAWVSVERHFRELGLNPATTPFTAVGIGDMSGDVFGNGLLRSEQTKLVAAFDHRHVFIDPVPDPAVSYVERQRLFDLPRSSWADYDQSLLSDGGGVFERSAKSVTLTDEIRRALAIDAAIAELTPDELIRAILMAPVDLLWNGGIGTYIKALSESDAEVGDRGNDSVRVSAPDLRCKVVAEGGNLGVSQLGRIEASTRGVRINTDAIDNSGGVDCSDHEVNLKILLAVAERNGDMTRKQRNILLESMADVVCAHVLENNYAQNRTLSAAVAEAGGMFQVHERLMGWLEVRGGLDRAVELLPSAVTLRERREQRRPLTRPELAVLLAYTKNTVTEQLMADGMPNDPALDDLVLSYFPPAIQSEHRDLACNHPLRNELIAMLLSNEVINRGGVSMVHRLIEETSANASDICLAHLAAWRIFELDDLWTQVRHLGTEVLASTQTALELDITRLGERATRWLLRNEPQPLTVDDVTARYRDSIHTLTANPDDTESHDAAQRVATLEAAGVPHELAARVASLGAAFGFLDLTTVARRTGMDPAVVAELHALIDDHFELATLRDWIVALPRDDHWQTMARSALRDQYFLEHAELTATVLEGYDQSEPAADYVDRWIANHAVAAERSRRTFADIASVPDHSLAHASVAIRALTQLRRSL